MMCLVKLSEKHLIYLRKTAIFKKFVVKDQSFSSVNKFDFPVSGIVSFKELATNLKIPTKTIVNELSLIEADEKLQYKLDIEPNELVWKVARIREIAGEKIILDKDYFNKSIVPILSKETCENSIYEYLESKLNLKISYARKEITVEEPTDEDRELLDLEGHSNIVIIKSVVYLDDTTLFQYTESRHRPDKFQFVDFARRTQN